MKIYIRIISLLIIISLLVSGCKSDDGAEFVSEPTAMRPTEDIVRHDVQKEDVEHNSDPQTIQTAENLEDSETRTVWISPEVPDKLGEQFLEGFGIVLTRDKEISDYSLAPKTSNSINNDLSIAEWIYVLAAPFPTIEDVISEEDFLQFWQNCGYDGGRTVPFSKLIMNAETKNLFETVFGKAAKCVEVFPADQLVDTAWDDGDNSRWTIIPFDELIPRWKVIRIDGISPIDNDFEMEDYLLNITFQLSFSEEVISNDNDVSWEIVTNRDADKFTSLLLTGTTALVRYTAQRMEEFGVDYPIEEIGNLLREADITHISNEVAFYEDCPPADPVRKEQRFCSSSAYYEMLEMIEVDLIELTGNHIKDWGEDPFIYTLELYQQGDIPYYGGGMDLEEARKSLLFEHNGNQLYFIGCSPSGPQTVWADEEKPGSNPCDLEWLRSEISFAIAKKFVPIVTFQHLEVEDFKPHSSQRVDFLETSKMGAVIVSGSQSHFPQVMTLMGDQFIHFGLGNLFFDQMFGYNQKSFIDRHIFYDGKYVSTELITIILEDYAVPREMTIEERGKFLEKIFENCDWDMQS